LYNSGQAPIKLNNKYQQIVGWQGEGVGEITEDCNLSIVDKYRIFVGENVPSGSTFTINFWYSKRNSDGTFTKIPESFYTQTLNQNAVYPRIVTTTPFNINLKKGEILARFTNSNFKDGFYLQSNSPFQRMIKTEITSKSRV